MPFENGIQELGSLHGGDGSWGSLGNKVGSWVLGSDAAGPGERLYAEPQAAAQNRSQERAEGIPTCRAQGELGMQR